MLSTFLLALSAIALTFIFIQGISQLRRRPFIMQILHLNVLFLALLIPVYASVLIFSFREGAGAAEYLFGVFNPVLFFILLFLYLLWRYRRSFIIYNAEPHRVREAARGVLDGRGWKYREERDRIVVSRPPGTITFVNQWPGVSIVHSSLRRGEGFMRELRGLIRHMETSPNLFSGVINIIMALFLLFFFLLAVL